MRKILFIPLFLLIGCFTLEAADFYLMYDPNCMNRLVYQSQVGAEIVKYSIQLSDKEQIMLEVPSEEQGRLQSFLPSQAFRCGNSFISQNLTGILQNKTNNVYLVKPASNNGYQILPVRSYDYYLQEGNYMAYNGQQFRFTFSPTQAAIGQDLSSNDPRGRVTFEGRIQYNCANALLFKQSSSLSPNASIDIVFVPQLGVVEQKSPQFNNTLKLVQVNDMATATFLQQQFCPNANQITDNTGLTDYSKGAFQQPQPPSDILDSRGEQQQKTAQFHVVEKGETLYGIARKYDVDIDNLRNWNDMAPNSSFLRTGTKLRVGPFTEDFSSRSVSNYDMPMNNRPVFKNQSSILPAWKTTSGIHVVKPGETLNSIAQMYGYTPERFRDFNNLAPNVRLREGQRLSSDHCITNGNAVNDNTFSPENYNDNSFQPSQPDFFIDKPSGAQQGNSNYDNQFFNRSARPGNYNFSSPGELNQDNTAPPSNQTETFEPYSIFNNEGNTNINSNTAKGGSNLNISPSQYDNMGSRNNSFGTPVPNTAAPAIDNTGTRREPFQNFNSPVPGVNPSGPVNPNSNPNRFNVSPPTKNDSNTFRLGGTTEFYNTPGSARRISHIVQQGETIETIARKYDIPLSRLLELNQMKRGDTVLPDQRIFLN